MGASDEQIIADAAVVHEAAAIAAAAVRASVEAALRAAGICHCRRCRAEAARTYRWAVAMLGLEADPPEARAPR